MTTILVSNLAATIAAVGLLAYVMALPRRLAVETAAR